MQEIELSGEAWKTPEDFYVAFLAALGAPEWHAHNLDALWDSIIGGSINQVNLPFRVHIEGISEMSEECKLVVEQFEELLIQARTEGYQVDISCD